MLAKETDNKVKVVIGLGKTGLSCARFLASRGERFMVIDSRQNPPGLHQLQAEFPDVEFEFGEFNPETLLNASQLIVSPGVDQHTPAIRQAVEGGVPLTGDVDIFARENAAPVVAITGSNAKSTVTTLVGEMAKADGVDVTVAGNIGLPVLDALMQEPASLYVLELSSFQLETTTNLGAEVATVLNVSPDHMDRYSSLDAYTQAKHRIYQQCRQAVINIDDPLTAPDLPESVTQWRFSLAHDAVCEFGVSVHDDREFFSFNGDPLMPVSDLRIAGRHNVANALAALALGHAAGFSRQAMISALKSFPGLPHRCQWVAEKDGVQWYNDSKGTNVGACVAAVDGLGGQGKVILLTGVQSYTCRLDNVF